MRRVMKLYNEVQHPKGCDCTLLKSFRISSSDSAYGISESLSSFDAADIAAEPATLDVWDKRDRAIVASQSRDFPRDQGVVVRIFYAIQTCDVIVASEPSVLWFIPLGILGSCATFQDGRNSFFGNSRMEETTKMNDVRLRMDRDKLKTSRVDNA
ncbi:hypothetical protein C0J52_26731 [Blattella germanica]|nr:hypothetical protein C0J52_26731 [Blattella germanica]